jgi:hypothetical protein
MLDDLGFPPFLVIFSFQTRNSNLETRNQFGLCPVLYRQRVVSTQIDATKPASFPSKFHPPPTPKMEQIGTEEITNENIFTERGRPAHSNVH